VLVTPFTPKRETAFGRVKDGADGGNRTHVVSLGS
jgi:hypothetical protein